MKQVVSVHIIEPDSSRTISSSFPAPETIFEKILHFQAQFLQIFAKFQLLRLKCWQKFTPETPVSNQKISSGDPTFKNLGSTYLPKKNLEYPPQILLALHTSVLICFVFFFLPMRL